MDKAIDLTTEQREFLRRFTIDGVYSDLQKKSLKKAGLIEWHGFWHLSDKGKTFAQELGYL